MADRDTIARMLAGMDNPAFSPTSADIPTGDTRDSGVASPAAPNYDTDPARQKQFIAQRFMRGLSDLGLGIGDVVNMVGNAGIRDVDYLTGGGLSGGSYDPFQFSMPSQEAANLSADVAKKTTGTDVVDPATMTPDMQKRGELAQQMIGMLPVGPEALAPAAKLAMAAIPGAKAGKGLLKAGDEALTAAAPKTRDDIAAVVSPDNPVSTMYHPLSVNKLRRPLEEMTATYEPGAPLLPMPEKEFDFEDVPMGSHFVGLLGDKTMGGQLLTGVNDMKFENPVELQAGSDFLRRADNPDETIWASDKGPITNYERTIRALQETGDPVYGVHVGMATRSGDYSRQTTNTLLQMIKHNPLSQEAKDAFDLAMRTPWGSGKKPIPAYPDFPGIDNITQEYLDKAGSARTKMAQLFDTAKFAKMGGPDVASARNAVIHPELRDAPFLATGHRIVKAGPEAVQHITDPTIPHHDYASQLAAPGMEFKGGVKPLPGVQFWQDWFSKTKPGLDEAKLQRSAMTQGLIQRKTPEWQERLMKFKMSEEGKKLGLAGAIGAGLITASEAKEMFGYEGET